MTGPQITPLDKLTNPLGGQQIELQQLDYPGGGMSLLRTRIREKSRFTIFEVDAQTAQAWGEALSRWAQTQPTGLPSRPGTAQAPGADDTI